MRASDVALDLGAQGAAADRERDGDHDRAVGPSTGAAWTMPRSTMSLPSSGSMTPRSSAKDLLVRGSGGRRGGHHEAILPVLAV